MVNLVIEELFNEENMDCAMKRIIRRSKGENRAEAEAFEEHWKEYGQCWVEDISNNQYHPNPYRGVWIPKKNGIDMRMLSIPATGDKILQLATAMKLAKAFDRGFHECSYGFRKHHSIQQAVRHCVFFANRKKSFVADLDIRGFFDNIEHSVLIGILEHNIRDQRIVRWIERIIKAGTLCNGRLVKKNKGISQGSPLSPLLANIVLNELDWYMEKQSNSFIRYADDIVLFCENLDEAEQSLRKIDKYMEDELKLQINWNKTYVYALEKIEYLGYQFQWTNSGWKLKIGKEKQKELFFKIKQYLKDNRKDQSVEWWNRIGNFNRGWINFYRKVPGDNLLPIVKEMDALEQAEIREKMVNLSERNRNYTHDMKYAFLVSAFVYNEIWYQKIMEGKK